LSDQTLSKRFSSTISPIHFFITPTPQPELRNSIQNWQFVENLLIEPGSVIVLCSGYFQHESGSHPLGGRILCVWLEDFSNSKEEYLGHFT